jgi:hypothetical protein
MLTARPYGDIKRFRAAADNMLAGLTKAAPDLQPADT